MKSRSIFPKKKIAFFVAILLLSGYIFYHIIGLFSEDMSTIITGVSTENTYLDYDGYIFRDETPLYSSKNGAAKYHIDDGVKISEGTTLATVYEKGGDSDTLDTLRLISDEIATLEKSVDSGYTAADLPTIRESINNSYYALVDELANRESDELLVYINKLRVGINSFNYASEGSGSAVDETLDQLRELQNSIFADLGAYVGERSEDGGYFYSYCDGYESMFTIEAAEGLSGESFDELSSAVNQRVATQGERRSFGKLAESSIWKLAMKIPDDKGDFFEEGMGYDVLFNSNSGESISMTLEKIIPYENDDSFILLLGTDRLPDGFIFNRAQNVRICVDSKSGIYVPKSAVHRENGHMFVYVLRGSVVHKRDIEILYDKRDYFLVSPYTEDTDEKIYLDTNELLILNGKNLFDGRILD